MKTKHFKILYFLIPMALFAFLSAFNAFAAVNADLPLPTGVSLPAEIARGNAAVRQIYVLFQFGLGAIGIVAFGSIIYGAVKYMAAAGDPGAITEAKGRIFSALWGIGIALTSIILLSTINPDLVNFLATGQFNVPGINYVPKCGQPGIGACGVKGETCYGLPAFKDGKESTAYTCLTKEEYQKRMATYLFNLGQEEKSIIKPDAVPAGTYGY